MQYYVLFLYFYSPALLRAFLFHLICNLSLSDSNVFHYCSFQLKVLQSAACILSLSTDYAEFFF